MVSRARAHAAERQEHSFDLNAVPVKAKQNEPGFYSNGAKETKITEAWVKQRLLDSLSSIEFSKNDKIKEASASVFASEIFGLSFGDGAAIKAKTDEISLALKQICTLAISNGISAHDALDGLAQAGGSLFFVKHPALFVTMAKAAKAQFLPAMASLSSYPSVSEFVSSQPLLSERLVSAAGTHTFNAFQILAYPEVRSLILTRSDDFFGMLESFQYDYDKGPFLVSLGLSSNTKQLFDVFFEILSSKEIDYDGKIAVILANDKSPVNLRHIFQQEKENHAITQRYGIRPMRISGYFDDRQGINATSEDFEFEKRVKAKIKAVSSSLNISPEYLAAAIFQEGLVGIMSSSMRSNFNSFEDIGMESFGGKIDALKQKGLLRKDFSENVDFSGKTYYHNEINETGMKVFRVNFKTIENVIEAFGALFAESKQQFLAFSSGAKLSVEQVYAGTYFFYNTGGLAKDDYLKPDSEIKNERNVRLKHHMEKILKPDAGRLIFKGLKEISNPRFNYMRVLATAALLKERGAFEESVLPSAKPYIGAGE